MILGEESVDKISQVQEEFTTVNTSFKSTNQHSTSSQLSIINKSEKIIKHLIVPLDKTHLKEKLHGLKEKVDNSERTMNLVLGKFPILAL